MVKPYTALSIANEIIKLSNFTVIPMRLQKLVYLAHGWYLALTGNSLIQEPVVVGPYGPLIEVIYKEFKNYGNNPIKNINHFQLDSSQVGTIEFLQAIINKHAHLSTLQLSTLVAQPHTPWQNLKNDHYEDYALMENYLIKTYFLSIGEKNKPALRLV